jgi:phosphodiesterase/alkaline phosphatase D-like protein
MKNLKKTLVGGIGVLLISAFLAPATSFAQTYYLYEPQNRAETLAYLYGRIAQLIELKERMAAGERMDKAVNNMSVDEVIISTKSASDVTGTTAVLRGEVLVYGKATASVWFEYGENENFLDLKTSRVQVKSAYDRAVRVSVSRLKENKRYYYRIATQGKDGVVRYGSIQRFYTD